MRDRSAGDFLSTIMIDPLSIVARHTARFDRPPCETPSNHFPDGPLLGNGDVQVVQAGRADLQTWHIGKSDFWTDGEGWSFTNEEYDEYVVSPITIGGVRLWIRDFASGTYQQILSPLDATLIGSFETQETLIEVRSWVEQDANRLIIELHVVRTGRPHPVVGFHARVFAKQTTPNRGGAVLPTAAMQDGDCGIVERETWDRGRWVCRAAMAMRIETPGETRHWTIPNVSTNTAFTLKAGERARIIVGIAGGRDVTDHRTRALKLARQAPDRDTHEQRWRDFWSRSAINLGGGGLERFWYGSLYTLACCTRPGCIAPGIYGFATDDHPRWSGDYHLNYNFEHPFAALCVANHAELLDPYERVIQHFVDDGKRRARTDLKPPRDGVYYPIGLAPWGIAAQDDYMGQKCAAAYAAWPFTEHFYHTLDPALTRDRLYPYVREVARFWSSYLVCEAGRWIIRGSASHEHGGHNVNTAFDLPLVRRALRAAIDMSHLLECDTDERRNWQTRLDNLAAYPTGEHDGRRVLIESEDAPGFTRSISLFNVIWPGAGDVGLGGDPALLETCRNTLAALDLWQQGNSLSWVYPAAIRVGMLDAVERLETHLRSPAGLRDNLTVAQAYGGLETCGAAAAINEMLLQSHDGILRIFPVWPAERAASFTNLRARGAFLVSASLIAGCVDTIQVTSERGGTLRIDNPWRGRHRAIAHDLDTQQPLQEFDAATREIIITTVPGQRVQLTPAPATHD